MSHIESAEPLSPEQQELWDRVHELWRLLQRRDIAAIRSAIHPQYIGWEAGSLLPHDRDFALKVAETDPKIVDFRLYPMRVEIYDGVVGVATTPSRQKWQRRVEKPRRCKVDGQRYI